MKRNFSAVLSVISMFAVILQLGGCAKPPTAEMEAAQTALTGAENDPNAVLYAESTLARARDALARMKAAADTKRYDSAKSYAAEVVAASEKAISDGNIAAARARQEGADLVSNLKQSMEETQSVLDSAKQKNGGNVDFESLDKDFDTARQTVGQVEGAVAGSRLQEAQEKGRNARAAFSSIRTRLADDVRVNSRKK
ncbi:MAG: DUF4398 domain-containing protein [Treponema sp.]|jgi:hypothetical protein|nr:DUF4398 domain-containing protein [Treponema sp.]